jgi:hypothetical protein
LHNETGFEVKPAGADGKGFEVTLIVDVFVQPFPSVPVTVYVVVPTVGTNGRSPSADAIQDGSEISAYDAWILLDSSRLLDRWDPANFGLGVIATVETNSPEGGFQTVSMTITMAVP